MKTKLIIASLFGIFIISTAQAQVGIGNPTPDSTSVLDLTNPNNRGFVLPTAASTAGFSDRVNGMTYFFNENIYYKTSVGYNAISPWKFKFNGNITNDVYYNLGGNIGIGSASLSMRPEAPLQIETIGGINLVDNGSFLIGLTSGFNLSFNNTELQSRNAGSAAPLTINEDGGNVVFGSNANQVNAQVSGSVQQLDAATNAYYDLLPPGTVVMWYGTQANVPAGWAICDGSTQNLADGSGTITTPNLSGRFVVGAGNNGITTYTAGNNGGEDLTTMTEAEMPSHNHYISLSTSTNGSHSHASHGKDAGNSYDYESSGRHVFVAGTSTTSSSGSHTHSVNGSSDNKGSGQAQENRPAYYSLVYMMKL